MITASLIKYIFKKEKEFAFFLGSEKQKGATVVFVDSIRVWKQEALLKKLKSILTLNWKPTESLLGICFNEVVDRTLFGCELDYAQGMKKINIWHNSQKWNLSNLTIEDIEKSESLNATSILIKNKHRYRTSNSLHLNLGKNFPEMCMLLHPMVVKVPVTSILYFTDIHSAFTFNEIRRAQYKNSEDLISYIYELQFIQQKIAISLYDLATLINFNKNNKGDALLMNSEILVIKEIELLFTYLKSSIEKVIVVLGLIYGIKNLESKKTHKSKLDYLTCEIPEKIKNIFYFDFVLENIKSENIEKLNSYRTGIMHKKGISNLQPHKYLDSSSNLIQLNEMFNFLIKQHSTNSIVIICVYALLTDELVKINPPSVSPQDLPY